MAGVPCMGLDVVGRPGKLVALRVDEAGWAPLREWPVAACAPRVAMARIAIPLAEPVTSSLVLQAHWHDVRQRAREDRLLIGIKPWM